MAYLSARPGGRFDIREAHATSKGPRSVTLASFRGWLTPEILERAATRALRPLEREKLLARAAELGIPVRTRGEGRGLRALLVELRAGAQQDPTLVTLLRDALAEVPSAPLPAVLADVAEWVGASDAQRGSALRDLLRVSDRVLRSRGKLRALPKPRFPEFQPGARGEVGYVPLALDEKIVALGRTLGEAQVPHAFGGALALAYYATPRGTHDIDLNVFVPAARAGRVLELLAGCGIAAGGETALREVHARGQTRLRWEHTPIDLFFSTDALHDSCVARVRRVPFGADEISILSAEDLAIFKVIFDRAKDWIDLAELLYAQGPDFDAAYVTGWLRRILADDDARLARFEALVRQP